MDLRRFRWHTGAELSPVPPDAPLPVMFRDLGPAATARLLRGTLRRLAGPLSPLTWMRSWRWEEPYVDHGRIGRLVLLRPRTLGPWHSGQPEVWVAPPDAWGDPNAVGWVPGDVPLQRAAALLAGARTADELREALGGAQHDAARAEALERIEELESSLARSERLLGPLRARRQLRDPEQALRTMDRLGLSEADLCCAWHHIPDDRRRELVAMADG